MDFARNCEGQLNSYVSMSKTCICKNLNVKSKEGECKIGVKPFKRAFLRPHGPVIFYLCNYSYSGYFAQLGYFSPRM